MADLVGLAPLNAQTFADILPYLIAGVSATLICFGVMVYLDIFTHHEVRAWRTISQLRGYSGPVGTFERLATRSSLIARLQKNLDLVRLLPIANVNLTPIGFIGETAAWALISMAIFYAMEVTGLATGDGWLFPPIMGIGVPILVFLLKFFLLRNAATKNQYVAGKTLSDMMMMVAIMTDGRGLQVEDAVRILSQCCDSDVLQSIVDNRGWTRLIKVQHKSTAELFANIGREFDIPMFTSLSEAMLNTNVGMAERSTFTNLAKISYQHRLTDARLRAARAKILVTIPVAGMLIPLLILIGFPAFQSITSGIGG